MIQKAVILLFFIQLNIFSQHFEVETIIDNGTTDTRINFVYMGDGYTEDELDDFLLDIQNASQTQFSYTPYQEYKNFFNVFAIKVISNESGTTHPQTSSDGDCAGVPVMETDTYFHSTFDAYGIHRLLVPGDWPYNEVTEVLTTNTPFYDQASVVVNTPYYGGSGGDYATGSTDESSGLIMVHETGHSFVNLADEYWAGSIYAVERANMTAESDPALVKWKNWLGDEEIDLYPYGTSGEPSEWYRPHQNCMMRALNNTFCAVCAEATIDHIYSLVSPIAFFSPSNNSISFTNEDEIEFKLDLIYPEPNTLEIKWFLDGMDLEVDQTNLTIDNTLISEGTHVLTAQVEDLTELSRTYTFASGYVFNVSWNVTNTTGIEENTVEKFLFKVYPNPSTDTLYFDYTIENISETIQISIVDLLGKELKTISLESSTNRDVLAIDLSDLVAGSYMLRVNTPTYKRSYKFIKQ